MVRACGGFVSLRLEESVLGLSDTRLGAHGGKLDGRSEDAMQELLLLDEPTPELADLASSPTGYCGYCELQKKLPVLAMVQGCSFQLQFGCTVYEALGASAGFTKCSSRTPWR